MTYVSPPRTFVPPSDIESEYGGDESDHESNTVGSIHLPSYRNVIILENVQNAKAAGGVQEQV